jgi:hypothetical protein
MNKTCFICKSIKPINSFYKHPQMPDGHVNKCIDCTKRAVIANRLDKIEHYRAFDKARASNPSRVKARLEYRKTEEGKLAVKRAHLKWTQTHPERKQAITKLGNAVRDKKVFKEPCFVCGDGKVEAHHPIYSMPLDVVWLCNRHHRETHDMANDLKIAA